jgi:thioredoxin 1
MRANTFLLVLLVLLLTTSPVRPSEEGEEGPILGPATRHQVEAAHPDWVMAEVQAEIDAGAARALAGVPAGARVAVYLGTWCSDSKRELSRLWRALDETGGQPPFDLKYVGVDRADKRSPEVVREAGLRAVPTFIVYRDGEEVGRVEEVAPHGIEKDLLALLRGEARGVVSDRPDSEDDPPDR